MNITHLVHLYGYGAVFGLVAVESLGVPLPGETALIAAATYAGTTHKLSIGLVFAVAVAAAILGDTTGYWIGDTGGYRLLYRYGRYVRLDESKIKVAHYLFERRGGAVVFFGRFVSVLRTYAAFLAGTTRMRYRRFLLFNASGGVAWAALYAFLAYYAGTFLSKVSTPFEIGFGLLAVTVIVVGLLLLRRQMSVLVERAEAAYPGPLPPPGVHGTSGAPEARSPSASVGARDGERASQEAVRPGVPGGASGSGAQGGVAAESGAAGERGEPSSREKRAGTP